MPLTKFWRWQRWWTRRRSRERRPSQGRAHSSRIGKSLRRLRAHAAMCAARQSEGIRSSDCFVLGLLVVKVSVRREKYVKPLWDGIRPFTRSCFQRAGRKNTHGPKHQLSFFF